jgi:DNA mismatch endonuclease (patch repair protein)
MRATPSRDTRAELRLRRELHRRGLRFRVSYQLPVNGRRLADVVFVPSRVAVFIDGCFWHGCEEHFRPPKSNTDWWVGKIERTRARDAETNKLLIKSGWMPLRVWEHESIQSAADRVEYLVDKRHPRHVDAGQA